MNFEKKQLETFLRSSFFDIYAEFEEKMCQIFRSAIQSEGHEDEKYRIYYFLGWKSENKFIDYDTFSYKSELQKFDKSTKLKDLHLLDWIRMNNKLNFYPIDSLSINSYNKKRETLEFFSNVHKVIRLRNILAHEYNKDIDNKHAVEILQDKIMTEELKKFYKEYTNNLDFSAITDNSRILFSDIFYLKRILQEEQILRIK
ncbi:DUF86 domain-containing protein [Lactococcus lactis subsp. lactis KLDS 4.0325]|nr:DUF86 domain-containing protein [Lactococcus lactis subsp. lactis KLDS 4.0325]MBN2936491.1 DUF86 domain-containing protein [Lactococcus lactis]